MPWSKSLLKLGLAASVLYAASGFMLRMSTGETVALTRQQRREMERKGITPSNSPTSSAMTAGAGGMGSSLESVDLGGGSFMRGWMIDTGVCDDLSALMTKKRASGGALKGQVSMKGGNVPVVNKAIKDSEEISFDPRDSSPEFRAYLQQLQATMGSYLQELPMAGAYGTFGLTSRTNLQWYPKGGGYKTWHTERTGRVEPEGSRHLVFMTYLNDVDDGGGTEFMHQKVTVQPRKGLTLIWPSDWTFTHRGVPSPTQEKSIITGWFNFNS